MPNVDVNQYPVDTTARAAFAKLPPENRELAIGDMHGNFMKLICSLQTVGVIDLSKKEYEGLASLEEEHCKLMDTYDTKGIIEKTSLWHTSDKSNYSDFRQALLKNHQNILNNIDKIKVTADNKKTLIRLIGDVLADRGANDYYTLYLIDHLAKQGLTFKISLSNHDNFYFTEDTAGCETNKQGRSYLHMQALDKAKIIDSSTGLGKVDVLEKQYRSLVEPISYSIQTNPDGTIAQLNIFNHAIAGPACLQALIKKYGQLGGFLAGIEYKAGTIQELCQTIDSINERFKKLTTGDLKAYQKIINAEKKLWEIKGTLDDETSTNPDVEKSPLLYLFWNRTVNTGDKWGVIDSIPVQSIHGHNGEGGATNGKNLDGNAGKRESNVLVLVGKNPLHTAQAYPSWAAYEAARSAAKKKKDVTDDDDTTAKAKSSVTADAEPTKPKKLERATVESALTSKIAADPALKDAFKPVLSATKDVNEEFSLAPTAVSTSTEEKGIKFFPQKEEAVIKKGDWATNEQKVKLLIAGFEASGLDKTKTLTLRGGTPELQKLLRQTLESMSYKVAEETKENRSASELFKSKSSTTTAEEGGKDNVPVKQL